MKRLITLLTTTLLLTAAFTVSAFAADFEPVAKELSTINMLQGTDAGLALDRVPNRQEAATMLVRLYGAEAEAMAAYNAGVISHPFTDVKDWANPYVAWLYSRGLTNGTSPTTFSADGTCTAQMYCTFLLRALGYEDNTDFVYEDALTFAQTLTFYDPTLFHGEFLVDDLAAVTYQALAVDLKDGSTYLLDSLVKSGAVSETAAAPILAKMDAYRAMNNANDSMNSVTAMDMDVDMVMDMTMSAGGETQAASTVTDGTMQIITTDPANVQMAYVTSVTVDGTMYTNMGTWMKDNWVYTSVTAPEGTVNTKQNVADSLAVLGSMDMTSAININVGGLAMVDSITTRTEDTDTIYEVVIGGNMAGYVDAVSDQLAGAGVANITGTEFTDILMSVTADQDGNLKAIHMTFGMSTAMTIAEETMEMAYSYVIDMVVKATGDSVVITYPDFTDFVDITPAPTVPESAA